MLIIYRFVASRSDDVFHRSHRLLLTVWDPLRLLWHHLKLYRNTNTYERYNGIKVLIIYRFVASQSEDLLLSERDQLRLQYKNIW